MSIVLLYTVYSTLKGKLSSQYRLFKNFFRHASFCHFLREWISKENLYQPWGSLWVFLCLVPCHVVRAKKSDVSRLFALGISPKWIDRKGLGKCRTRQRSKVGQFRVPKYLAFKTRLRAKPFLWKWVSFAWQKQSFSNQWQGTSPRKQRLWETQKWPISEWCKVPSE